MNLQQFIDYKEHCPICGGLLATTLWPKEKYAIEHKNGRATINFLLQDLDRRRKKYKAAYSLGLQDNSLMIEFYDNKGNPRSEVPFFLQEKFRDFHNNLSTNLFSRFRRKCLNCILDPNGANYNYSSRFFELNYKLPTYPELIIEWEKYFLTYQISDNRVRKYLVVNYIYNNETVVYINYTDLAGKFEHFPTSQFTVPLFPFISREKTIDFLNDLLIYS